jgi:hypothetical protein
MNDHPHREFMERYLPDGVEYPENLVAEPLALDQCSVFVSHSYLDGFINYVKIVSAWLIPRYNTKGEHGEYKIQIMDPPGSFNWVEKTFVGIQFYKLVSKNPRVLCHTKISYFGDDVAILGRVPVNEEHGTATREYVFFYYDCDVSDCMIGRFLTENAEEEVLQRFNTYAEWLGRQKAETWEDPLIKSLPIPPAAFPGWISW